MAREIQRFMVTIKGLIVHDDAVLLLHEANAKSWELPGGRYDVGEEALPPEKILEREIAEELGVTIQCIIKKPFRTWIRPIENAFVFIVAFECELISGTPQLSQEHDEFRWVTKDNCKNLSLAPGYSETLDQFWKNR